MVNIKEKINRSFAKYRLVLKCEKMKVLEKKVTKSIFKVGDEVLVSPQITHEKEWIKGVVIEVEDNPFVGIVITAKTKLGDIFEKEYLFKKMAS